jgi:hypothetical protein
MAKNSLLISFKKNSFQDKIAMGLRRDGQNLSSSTHSYPKEKLQISSPKFDLMLSFFIFYTKLNIKKNVDK